MSPKPVARVDSSRQAAHHYIHTNKNVLSGGLWLLLEREAGPRMSLATKKRYMRGWDDRGSEGHGENRQRFGELLLELVPERGLLLFLSELTQHRPSSE